MAKFGPLEMAIHPGEVPLFVVEPPGGMFDLRRARTPVVRVVDPNLYLTIRDIVIDFYRRRIIYEDATDNVRSIVQSLFAAEISSTNVPSPEELEEEFRRPPYASDPSDVDNNE